MARLAPLLRSVSLGAIVLTASGCQRLTPPQIQPESVTTSAISPQGADVEAMLDVYNPNSETLTASGIDTKVTIGGKPNVARAVVTEQLVLPGGERIKAKMPIHVEWTDPPAVAGLAEKKEPAPYVVEGTVHFVGKGARLETAFKLQGTMSPTELGEAAGTAPKPPASASASGSAARPGASGSASPSASASGAHRKTAPPKK